MEDETNPDPSLAPDSLPPKPRGFAKLKQTAEGRAKIREIASRGGKAAHALGRAHEFTDGEEARAAGRKGGFATHAKRKATPQNGGQP